MFRLQRFVNTQTTCGTLGPEEQTCDDTKTSMSEIVKRFFRNEPIPQYNQEEMFDYGDETITHNVVHLDENGHPLKDSKGNIITHEVLNDEVLNLIPIHPNIEDIDVHGDNDELARTYGEANERLSAFQRVQAQKIADKKASDVSKAVEIAKKNGYVKQSDNIKSEE